MSEELIRYPAWDCRIDRIRDVITAIGPFERKFIPGEGRGRRWLDQRPTRELALKLVQDFADAEVKDYAGLYRTTMWTLTCSEASAEELVNVAGRALALARAKLEADLYWDIETPGPKGMDAMR